MPYDSSDEEDVPATRRSQTFNTASGATRTQSNSTLRPVPPGRSQTLNTASGATRTQSNSQHYVRCHPAVVKHSKKLPAKNKQKKVSKCSRPTLSKKLPAKNKQKKKAACVVGLHCQKNCRPKINKKRKPLV